MDEEYRYPLTRICLRNGALTLPRTMLGLFPEEGAVRAVDTLRDVEFELQAVGPRSIAGLHEFFQAHDLDVNDELSIRPLEDGRFAFTPLPHRRKPDYGRPGAVAALLDELAEAELSANEAEIRALYPDLPANFDVRALLEADERFVYFEARWHARAALERRIDEEEARRGGGGRKGAGSAPATAAPEAKGAGPARNAGGPTGAQGAVQDAAPEVPASRPEPARHDPAPPSGAGEARQDALWQSTWQEPWHGDEAAPWSPATEDGTEPAEEAAGRSAPEPGGSGRTGVDERPLPSDEQRAEPRPVATPEPVERGTEPSVRERRASPPRAVFPGDAVLAYEDDDEDADLRHVGQARELLQGFGFRVEALGQSQLMVHAELGRRAYAALVYALGFGQRLDWAALLARRREAGARYLAVFGDRRDLQRLQSPAELARATLWSWEGLHRARTLSQSVPVSPFDLELHFEREGLFGHGLERFEKNVAALVAERGAFSEVLSHLAGMRAPTVFLLEDLAGRGTLSRDVVLKVLERLSEAPFHLVARVGQGEFCLRLTVSDGLGNLVDYASSLRGRLPNRNRERLTGLGEPEWLQAAEAAPQGAVGVVGGEAGPVDEGGGPADVPDDNEA